MGDRLCCRRRSQHWPLPVGRCQQHHSHVAAVACVQSAQPGCAGLPHASRPGRHVPTRLQLHRAAQSALQQLQLQLVQVKALLQQPPWLVDEDQPEPAVVGPAHQKSKRALGDC